MVTDKDVVDYDRRMLDDKMDHLADKLDDHIIMDKAQYQNLMDLVKENKVAIANLTNIWTQTKGAVFFIKIVVAVTASLAGIWAFLNSHITFKG